MEWLEKSMEEHRQVMKLDAIASEIDDIRYSLPAESRGPIADELKRNHSMDDEAAIKADGLAVTHAYRGETFNGKKAEAIAAAGIYAHVAEKAKARALECIADIMLRGKEHSRRAAGPPFFPTCALNMRRANAGACKQG